jgi:hypothetical protein
MNAFIFMISVPELAFTADESAVPVSVVKRNEEFHLSGFR